MADILNLVTAENEVTNINRIVVADILNHVNAEPITSSKQLFSPKRLKWAKIF